MLARVLAVIVFFVCLCVSVCLSHASFVSKRLNVGARKQRHVIAKELKSPVMMNSWGVVAAKERKVEVIEKDRMV